MDITDKIHCDDIIFCSHAKLQSQLDKRFNAPLSVKRLLAKFPLIYKKDPEDKRDFLLASAPVNILEGEEFPKVVDHMPMMTSVKNQGRLGSCVAFAVTSMKEWQETYENQQEILKGKRDTRKGKVYDLSEAWLYWKCKEIDLWPDEEGTSIRYAMKVLNKIGIPSEKAWPYNDTNFGKPKGWATMIAKWGMIASYWRLNNLDELKKAIIYEPAVIGIQCFYEIFVPTSDGVVTYPENPSDSYGGHAICAVGYDDNKKLIKFKNSWGTGWGQNGYGYLPYKYIEDFMLDAWTCKDLSVTKDMLKG